MRSWQKIRKRHLRLPPIYTLARFLSATAPQLNARLLLFLPRDFTPRAILFAHADWFVGYAARTFGEAETARTAFTAARSKLEKIVHEQPEYAAAWSLLGRVDAALGRKEEAIRE